MCIAVRQLYSDVGIFGVSQQNFNLVNLNGREAILACLFLKQLLTFKI
jgi:hypothetical protein